MEEVGMLLGFLILGFIISSVFFMPTIIAIKKNHTNKTAIIATNVLVGWTFIGWVYAFIWSLSNPQTAGGQNVIIVQDGKVSEINPNNPDIPKQEKQKYKPQTNASREIYAPPKSLKNQDYKIKQVPPPVIPQAYQDLYPAEYVSSDVEYKPTDRAPVNFPHYNKLSGFIPAVKIPLLVGISGQYAGQKIGLDKGPVVIGRDPMVANLIYANSDKAVSRKHCTVSYDRGRSYFTIVDTSTNGTFLLPQERLRQGMPVQIESGSRFFISDPSEQFEVRVE